MRKITLRIIVGGCLAASLTASLLFSVSALV